MTPTAAEWRSTNLGARLFAAAGRVIAVKLAVVHAAGFDVTSAQLALFHALDPAGTRLTVLAARAGLSKASMAELVDRAEATGLVVRRPDPGDARGRIVVATAVGDALLVALAAGLAAARADVVTVLGDDATARVSDSLARYLAGGSPAPAPSDRDPANVARLIAEAAARFPAEVAIAVAARGFAATPALLGMIRHMALAGSRLTDLAARARTTKPAMRELVDRAESLGFVARQADANDRRARTIIFTARGVALLDTVHSAVLATEAAVAARIGEATLTELRRALVRLIPGDAYD